MSSFSDIGKYFWILNIDCILIFQFFKMSSFLIHSRMFDQNQSRVLFDLPYFSPRCFSHSRWSCINRRLFYYNDWQVVLFWSYIAVQCNNIRKSFGILLQSNTSFSLEFDHDNHPLFWLFWIIIISNGYFISRLRSPFIMSWYPPSCWHVENE